MSTRKRWMVALAVLVGAVLVTGRALGILRSHSGYAVDGAGFMLGGFDPVSYFPEGGGRPIPGDPAFEAAVDGRRYRFASSANRERFEKDPGRYEPQYGGWCAYAVSQGYKFDASPESFLVEDGRLFVFYDGILGDARAEFEKEGVADGVTRADGNWPALAKD